MLGGVAAESGSFVAVLNTSVAHPARPHKAAAMSVVVRIIV